MIGRTKSCLAIGPSVLRPSNRKPRAAEVLLSPPQLRHGQHVAGFSWPSPSCSPLRLAGPAQFQCPAANIRRPHQHPPTLRAAECNTSVIAISSMNTTSGRRCKAHPCIVPGVMGAPPLESGGSSSLSAGLFSIRWADLCLYGYYSGYPSGAS
jgi:hypothetical protein